MSQLIFYLFFAALSVWFIILSLLINIYGNDDNINIKFPMTITIDRYNWYETNLVALRGTKRASTIYNIPIFDFKNASNLNWPAILPNGSISLYEGTEIMPISGLQVPRFWEPSEGLSDDELLSLGREVGGLESILLMIASYRDFQCIESISSALSSADHPNRLFFAIVDQTKRGDVGCLDINISCSVDPFQVLCKYSDQISIYRMNAKYSTGYNNRYN